jgi:protein-S-isoprenylcysteine O-methyltransferase Ste14
MNRNIFFLLTAVCILTHIVRTVYEILKHRKLLISNRYSFTIVFTNMIVLWISWFLLCSMDEYQIELPVWIRFLGLGMVILGVLVFLTALSTIKSLENYAGDLITHGIYSRIRHPMYLAFILWLIGSPLFYESGLSLAIGIILSANVLFWRHLEEMELINRFSGYREYRKRTLF